VPGLLKVETESVVPAGTGESPPTLFPCRQQRQVVSEVALLVPGVDPRFWHCFAHLCRENIRCDSSVRPLSSVLSSTRTHNASSSWKLHAPPASTPHKLLASQPLSPVPTESMAAGHSGSTRQLDSQSPWPAGSASQDTCVVSSQRRKPRFLTIILRFHRRLKSSNTAWYSRPAGCAVIDLLYQ
ncbi:unnamed protein product, partial [Ectocarpus sp. 8 AP-2014]